MPEFSMLPQEEAARLAEEAAVSDALAWYVDLIARLSAGHAGRLVPTEGEDIRLIRLRLGAAARRLKKNVVIRRAGDEVLFWLREAAA